MNYTCIAQSVTSVLSQFTLTIVKPQCPVSGIWRISKGNVLCTYLANSLQPSFSLHIYSFVQEWLWLKLLTILPICLRAGRNICWRLHPAAEGLLNLCRNCSCSCVTACVIISHVTYLSVCRVFMWNISVWNFRRFSHSCVMDYGFTFWNITVPYRRSSLHGTRWFVGVFKISTDSHKSSAAQHW